MQLAEHTSTEPAAAVSAETKPEHAEPKHNQSQQENSDWCLRVSQVAKTYRVFDSPAQRLKDLLGLAGSHQDVLALKPLSFGVKRGETVAIVGANGSGKSTLLQMICGTLTPSAGDIKRQGRIAALLELGAGFNNDFSGLDNVYLNASINGLNRARVDAILPDILRFADIGDYIHQPVSTYSSGMYVRLAFAVAIHVDPELLIIDEALSVGDEAFQRKCFARLRELQAKGMSILFVSHAAESVVSLCDRALVLDKGDLLFDGQPRQAIALYQKLLYARPEQRQAVREEILTAEKVALSDKGSHTLAKDSAKEPSTVPEQPTAEASHSHKKTARVQPAATSANKAICKMLLQADTLGEQVITPHRFDFVPSMLPESTDYQENGAHIKQVMLLDQSGQQVNILHKGRRYRYCYQVDFSEAAENIFCGMQIKRLDGIALGGMVTAPLNQLSGLNAESGQHFKVEFEFVARLNAGSYFMNAGVYGGHNQQEGFLARKLDALMFKVLPQNDECATGSIDFGATPKLSVNN